MEHHASPFNPASLLPEVVLAPTSPERDLDMAILPVPTEKLEAIYESPLYTEINIPLPRLLTPKASRPSSTPSQAQLPSPPTPTNRSRSRTLSALSPFHRSTSTSPSPKDAEEWPRIRKDRVKSKEVYAMMDLGHHGKKNRRGTIDALAIVPAVLVLSAELFTPGSGDATRGKRKDSGVGRWEDGIR